MADAPAQNKKRFYNNKKRRVQDDYTPSGDEKILSLPIEDLELSENTYNALKQGRVNSIFDIVKRRMTDMYKIQNIGKRNCLEILGKLKKYNLTFREESPKEGENTQPQSQNNRGNQPNNRGEQPNNRGAQQSNREVSQPNRNNNPQNNRNATQDSRNQGQRRGERNSFDGDRESRQKRSKNNSNLKNGGLSPNRGKPAQVFIEPAPTDPYVKYFKKGKWGFRDATGKVLIPADYDDAYNYSEDLACVERDEKYGYIDRENNIVIPLEFEFAMSFSEGYAVISEGEKSGYINKQGEVILPCKYDVATPFKDGQALVRVDDRWGFIKPDGEIHYR